MYFLSSSSTLQQNGAGSTLFASFNACATLLDTSINNGCSHAACCFTQYKWSVRSLHAVISLVCISISGISRCKQTCAQLASKQCWPAQAHQQPEAGPKGPWSSNALPPATTGRVPGLPRAPLTQTSLNTPPPFASSSTSPAPSSASTTTGDNP